MYKIRIAIIAQLICIECRLLGYSVGGGRGYRLRVLALQRRHLSPPVLGPDTLFVWFDSEKSNVRRGLNAGIVREETARHAGEEGRETAVFVFRLSQVVSYRENKSMLRECRPLTPSQRADSPSGSRTFSK